MTFSSLGRPRGGGDNLYSCDGRTGVTPIPPDPPPNRHDGATDDPDRRPLGWSTVREGVIVFCSLNRSSEEEDGD